jgi:putative toxin-antitoxin system antitoxin component (TIGR02293 family)
MVDRGLPVRALEKISTAVAPNDNNFKYRIVSKASLARSKSSRRLSPNHSVVVARLASIWATALRIWKSEESVRAFLNRPHPLLAGRRPLDLILENEIGAELVRSILGRLEYGSAV